MAVPKLLRVKIPGLTKLNTAFEQWANWIEYSVAVRGRWPLMVSRTPTGNEVSLDGSGFSPRIMFVTSDIEAMSGSTTGVGQAVDADYDSATGDLTAGDGPAIDVRNYHEKAFLTAGIIAAFPEYGEWWACDVNKCSKYQ